MDKGLKFILIILRSLGLALFGYFVAKYDGGYYFIYNHFGTKGVINFILALIVISVAAIICLIDALKGD